MSAVACHRLRALRMGRALLTSFERCETCGDSADFSAEILLRFQIGTWQVDNLQQELWAGMAGKASQKSSRCCQSRKVGTETASAANAAALWDWVGAWISMDKHGISYVRFWKFVSSRWPRHECVAWCRRPCLVEGLVLRSCTQTQRTLTVDVGVLSTTFCPPLAALVALQGWDLWPGLGCQTNARNPQRRIVLQSVWKCNSVTSQKDESVLLRHISLFHPLPSSFNKF